MKLTEHLRELRRRTIWSLIGIGAASVVGWLAYQPVIDFMTQPLSEIAGTNTQLNFQTISAAFDLKLKVAVWAGVIISSPWWIFQLARFIGPGMKKGERLHALVFGLVGALLFLGGAIAGVIVAPRAVAILVSFVPDQAAALLAAESYVNFYTYLVIAFGISFLIPELLVAANYMGLIKGKTLLHGWRVAVVVAFTFAAVINPLPSPVPMIIQALALLGLYFAAVLIAHLHDRRQAKRRAAAEAEMGATPVTDSLVTPLSDPAATSATPVAPDSATPLTPELVFTPPAPGIITPVSGQGTK